MQKTAKNISLSVAGMMVAVPAGADIASIDYVQRWVQNQSPIPAGSVISGYASGSYGSYLLAGSTVGGPYSGVSISDLASKIPGSKITGYETFSGSTDTNIGGVLVHAFSASGASIKLQYVSDFIKSLYPYQYALFSPGVNTGMTSYMSPWGSYIGGYATGLGSVNKILGAYVTGSSGAGNIAAKWYDVADISLPTGTGYHGYVVMSSGSGLVKVPGSHIGSMIAGFGSSNYYPGNFLMGANQGAPYYVAGSTVVAGLTSGSVDISVSGVEMLVYKSGLLGRVPIASSSNNRSLSAQLFKGLYGGAPAYILGNSNGTTGVAAYSYNVSNLGTVIGTVKGSQVKIEQTTTAEDLQKNTGTIYFPVVQNGTIYGVTLNDFYILMNAQF